MGHAGLSMRRFLTMSHIYRIDAGENDGHRSNGDDARAAFILGNAIGKNEATLTALPFRASRTVASIACAGRDEERRAARCRQDVLFFSVQQACLLVERHDAQQAFFFSFCFTVSFPLFFFSAIIERAKTPIPWRRAILPRRHAAFATMISRPMFTPKH